MLLTPIALLSRSVHGAGGDRLVGPLPPSRPDLADRKPARVVFLPALVRGMRSPYRENLAPIVPHSPDSGLIRRQAAKAAQVDSRRLICLLLLSLVVSSYRRMKWENVRPEEVATRCGARARRAGSAEASGEPDARFHAFDSFLLTVRWCRPWSRIRDATCWFVPLLRGVLPRSLYSGKGAAPKPAQVWLAHLGLRRSHDARRRGASIAPSMPGDLYDAGGVLYIALGALIWGALLGLVDGWKSICRPIVAAAITVLVATHCAMSVERDFDHSVAAFIQIFLLLIVVAGLVAMVRPAGADYSLGLNPGLERT